jgi:hypothetical protein
MPLIWDPPSHPSGTSIALPGYRTSFSCRGIDIAHCFLRDRYSGRVPAWPCSATHSSRDISQQGARQAEHRDVSDGQMRSCLEESILVDERVVYDFVYRKRRASTFDQGPRKPAQSKTYGS